MDNFNEVAKDSLYKLVSSLKSKGFISSRAVEEAFKHSPRHMFLNEFYVPDTKSVGNYSLRRLVQSPRSKPTAEYIAWLRSIYVDEPLVTAIDDKGIPISSSTAPWLMALMLEALQVHPESKVLEIGTGTGYNMALLIYLASDIKKVISIEIDSQLAHKAMQNIEQLVGKKPSIYIGNGLSGYSQDAPYDRIVATGGYPQIPLTWLDQLSEGGILVMNLRKPLFGGILQLHKVSERRSALGHFLATPSVAFTSLQNPSQSSSLYMSPDINLYRKLPVTIRIALHDEDLNASMLWTSSFAIFLQFEFPSMNLLFLHKNTISSSGLIFDPTKFTTYLIDTTSQTAITFNYQEASGRWLVEVRGHPQVWEKLNQAYQQWIKLQRPQISSYIVEIDDFGKQTVKIESAFAGQYSPEWILD